jgi:prepilin-type N-terminal cleavage/methylation domain-containing protein
MVLKKETQKGFTILELAVCLAVIGSLSSFALPLFKNYQSRARSSEGKVILSRIYHAENSFYAMAGSYTNCLDQTSYSPPTSDFYYSHGFVGNNEPFELSLVNEGFTIYNCDKFFYRGTRGIEKPLGPLRGDFNPRFKVTPDLQSYIAIAGGHIGRNEIASMDSLFFPLAYAYISQQSAHLFAMNQEGKLVQFEFADQDIILDDFGTLSGMNN